MYIFTAPTPCPFYFVITVCFMLVTNSMLSPQPTICKTLLYGSIFVFELVLMQNIFNHLPNSKISIHNTRNPAEFIATRLFLNIGPSFWGLLSTSFQEGLAICEEEALRLFYLGKWRWLVVGAFPQPRGWIYRGPLRGSTAATTPGSTGLHPPPRRSCPSSLALITRIAGPLGRRRQPCRPGPCPPNSKLPTLPKQPPILQAKCPPPFPARDRPYLPGTAPAYQPPSLTRPRPCAQGPPPHDQAAPLPTSLLTARPRPLTRLRPQRPGPTPLTTRSRPFLLRTPPLTTSPAHRPSGCSSIRELWRLLSAERGARGAATAAALKHGGSSAGLLLGLRVSGGG